MCWKQEYRFGGCGHRVVVEDASTGVIRCPAAQAYGHVCIGSFGNDGSELLVEQGVCPECKKVGEKKAKRNWFKK